MWRLEVQPYKLRTTPYCHCGQFPEVSQNPTPTTASPGESGPSSLQFLVLHFLTSLRTMSALCCGFLFLPKLILWHAWFPPDQCVWVPPCYTFHVHPTPNLCDIGSPVPCTTFNRLAFFFSLLFPNTSPLLALLSCSELKPRSQE